MLQNLRLFVQSYRHSTHFGGAFHILEFWIRDAQPVAVLFNSPKLETDVHQVMNEQTL